MKKTIQHPFKFFRYLPGCLLLFIPASLYAQRDTTKKLKEVNVSSTKAPVIEAIVPSQQVSANDFTRHNALNVADAIRNFSGVNIKDYGGIGGLKTISVRGLGANHTAVLYDGVQINDAENGQVDLGKLNLNNVQHITLYNAQPFNICMPARSFASASLLSIETTIPDLTPAKPYSITAGIKAGSFGLFNPYLQWKQRLNSNWSFIINSNIENANGSYKYLINNGSTTTQQVRSGADISAQQVDGSLYWKADNSKFNFHINYYNSDRGLPGAVILYTPPPSGQRLWNNDVFLQSGYEHTWASMLHLLLNAKFSKNYLHYFDPQFPNSIGGLDQHFTQHEYYQSEALSYFIRPNWQVSYAADFSVNNMDADLPNFKYPIRITLLNVAATNLVIDKLTLQASLLNTIVKEHVKNGITTPGSNIYSPKIMATLKPFDDKNFWVRGFYKYIFRVPTFNELYYGFVTNTNLKPEYTRQYDLGFTYSKNLNGVFDYIIFTTDAYYNNVTNKIVYTPNLFNGSVQNFGKVDIKGVDAGLKTQVKLNNGYKALLSVNYSFQEALNITDPTSSTYLNQLPYIPKNTLAINAGIDRGKVGIYYNQLISSSRYYTNNNLPGDYLPPYAVADVTIVYKSLVNNWSVTASAGINNIFNKSYVVVQSYPMPGRSVSFSFQITI